MLTVDAARLVASELHHAKFAETLGTGISHRDLNTCTASAAGDRFLLGAAEDEPTIHIWVGTLLAARVLVCSLANGFLGVWRKTKRPLFCVSTKRPRGKLVCCDYAMAIRCRFFKRMYRSAEMHMCWYHTKILN